MLEIKRTEAETIIDEASQEQERLRSLEGAIWMLDQVISCVRHDRIDHRDRHARLVGGLLENARRELAAQLEELEGGRTARMPASPEDVNEKIILLAQSDPDERAFTLRALEKAGIESRVVVTSDGVEALNYLFGTGDHEGRDTGSMPELVLLDLRMPRLNGIDVLRHMRFRERTKPLPVLIFVSSAEEQDTLSGPKPDGYILKPLDFAKLSEAMRRLKLYQGVSN